MPKSSIPSPARSLGSITPRRHRTRLSRSVGGSPGRNASRMTALEKLKAGNRDSFVPSPLSKTVLNDNTDIEEPRCDSWWKNVDKSRDMMEVLDERPVGTNNIVDEFDVEILSQEKKENYSMDIPESSGSESIASIIVPQRKLFTQKENKLDNKYKQIIGTRDSTTKNQEHEDKPVEAGRKTLFGQSKHAKPIFPSALLNISHDKTLIGNKTKELAADIPPPRNLFGNRMGTKKKNMFTDFIFSESEDEIPDIQTRRFTFTKRPEPLPRMSSTSRRDTSPASSITTDLELDDWKLLPSSTMMEHQLEDATTPARRARLSKLIETRETNNTNSTANKTRQSDKSGSSKVSTDIDNELGKSGVQIEEQVLSPPKNINSSKNEFLTKTKNASHGEKELDEPINRDFGANNGNKSKTITKNSSRVETLFDDPATNEIETGTNEVETYKIDNLTKTLNKTSDVYKIDNLTRTLNKTNKQLSKSNVEEDIDVDANKIDNLTRTLNKTNNKSSKSKIDESNKSTVETKKVEDLTHTLNKSNKLSKSIIEDMDVDANKIDNLTRTLNKTNNKSSKSKIDESNKSTVETKKVEDLTHTLNKSNKLSKSIIEDMDVDANKIDNLTRTLNKTNNKSSKSKIDESNKSTFEIKKVDNLTHTLNKSNKLSRSNTSKQDALELELASIVGQEERILNEDNDEHFSLVYENEPEVHQEEQNVAKIISAANVSDNKTTQDNMSAHKTEQNKTTQIKEKTLVTETPMPRKSKSVMSRVVNETLDTMNSDEQLDNLDINTDNVDEDAIFKPSQELRRSTEKPNKGQENNDDSKVEGDQQITKINLHKNRDECKLLAKNTEKTVENEELAEVNDQEGVNVELEKEHKLSHNEENDVMEVDEQEQDVNESEPLIEDDDEENYSEEIDDQDSEQEDVDNSQQIIEEKDDSQEIVNEEHNQSQEIVEEKLDESQEIDNEEQNISEEIENDEHNEIEESGEGCDESHEIENDEQNESREIVEEQQDESQEIVEEQLDESLEMEEQQDESQEIKEQQNESQEMEEEQQDESHEIEEEQQNMSQEMEEEQPDESQEIEEENPDESLNVESEQYNSVLIENDEHDISEEVEHESESQEIVEQNTSQVHSENQVDSEIPDTPNASHDTTGRHRKKDTQKPPSPENILHSRDTPMESFVGSKGRNTSIRKTILKKNYSLRQTIAPARESTDGGSSKNSTVEGSGWDSHRNERKTLRLTFGKEFSPRKSLRTMVMEKSAKRQTIIDDANIKLHQANSTELPMDMEYEESDIVHEDPKVTQHDISLQTRRAKLDDYWQRFKKDTIREMAQIENEIRQSLTKNVTKGDFVNSRIPSKLVIRHQPLKLQTAPKTKGAKRTLAALENLPPELVEDMKYKPPKRFRPSNAPWITNRLYNFLENKLKPKYDYKARVRAEKLVEAIYVFSRDLRRLKTATPSSVTDLKREMARLDVVKTHYEFYHFFNEFLPNEVRFKVVPDIVNKIPTPTSGVFSDILQSDDIC